jgi:hypothetical protein
MNAYSERSTRSAVGKSLAGRFHTYRPFPTGRSAQSRRHAAEALQRRLQAFGDFGGDLVGRRQRVGIVDVAVEWFLSIATIMASPTADGGRSARGLAVRAGKDSVPAGVRVFDRSAAAALRQRPFVLYLNRIAKLPLTAAWFPEIETTGQVVVAVAPAALRDEKLRAAIELARRPGRS